MSPTEVIRHELSHSMRADARLAAMIVLLEPSRIGDEPIGDFLLKIKCVRRDTVMGWLQAAGVNPWRAGRSLNECQRRALARELTRFWKHS
jgi:hypothetical protein